MIKGIAKIDGIALGEGTFNLLVPDDAKLTAKAAFVSSKTGKTHGWTSCSSWSKETLKKLQELRALMEKDIAEMHFSAVDDLSEEGLSPSMDPAGVSGLGELLRGDAPQA